MADEFGECLFPIISYLLCFASLSYPLSFLVCHSVFPYLIMLTYLCIPALLVGVRLGYVRCIRGVVIPRSSCSRHCSRYRFSFCGHIGPSPCLVLGSYPYNPLTCILFRVPTFRTLLVLLPTFAYLSVIPTCTLTCTLTLTFISSHQFCLC